MIIEDFQKKINDKIQKKEQKISDLKILLNLTSQKLLIIYNQNPDLLNKIDFIYYLGKESFKNVNDKYSTWSNFLIIQKTNHIYNLFKTKFTIEVREINNGLLYNPINSIDDYHNKYVWLNKKVPFSYFTNTNVDLIKMKILKINQQIDSLVEKV